MTLVGAWADRRGRRRRTMIGADLGRAALLATRSRLEAAPLLLAIAMADGVNHGPFGEKNFFIPNLHWPYGLGRARTRLTSTLHFGHRGRRR